MKGDRELCTNALTQNGKAMQFVSTELQGDLKIRTLAAVQQQAKALEEAPEELKKDRGFMIMVMKANGMALEHLGKEMKGDRELCTAAVAQNYKAFEQVAAGMKSDEEIVILAVRNFCALYTFAFKESSLWEWLPADMKQNERVLITAGRL